MSDKVGALEQEIDVSRAGAPQSVVMDNPRSILHSNIQSLKCVVMDNP